MAVESGYTILNGVNKIIELLENSSDDAFTLITEKDFDVNTQSTSQITVGSIEIDSETVDGDCYYVSITDKAGVRSGHFHTSNNFYQYVSGISPSTVIRWVLSYSAGTPLTHVFSSGTYGIYLGGATVGENKTTFNIFAKYSSSYSKTIDGTYTVKIYKLNLPT